MEKNKIHIKLFIQNSYAFLFRDKNLKRMNSLNMNYSGSLILIGNSKSNWSTICHLIYEPFISSTYYKSGESWLCDKKQPTMELIKNETKR